MKRFILALTFCLFALPASAQVMAQWGQDATGTNRSVYIRNPANGAWVAIGSFNSTDDTWSIAGTLGCSGLPALTGDVTTTAGSCATTLATVNPNTGSYGDSTHVAQVTLDGKGRATAASSVLINAPQLLSATWASPGAIGSTTPNSGAFTSLAATSGTVTGPWYINQGSFTPNVNFPNSTAPLGINESATGTCTTGANNCYFNFLNISSDNSVVGSGTSGTWVNGIGLFVNHSFGGPAATGNRAAGTFVLKQTATTGNTALGADYTALVANTSALANDNGTGVTSSTARGQVESFNIIATLGASATNFFALQGQETDISALAGSSMYEKVGHAITQLANDAVQGSVYDAALSFTNQGGAVGWKGYGIAFGGPTGAWPFTSAATVIGCWSTCGAATSFIDMTNATFSGYFLKSANFSVSGAGKTLIASPAATGVNPVLWVQSWDGATAGGEIAMTDLHSGATNPNKTMRVSDNGDLQFLNSAGSVNIFDLSDVGVLTHLTGIALTSGTITPGAYTVSTLPAGSKGQLAYVTDATSCTYLGSLTGGGSTYCPVTYNGSAWVGG